MKFSVLEGFARHAVRPAVVIFSLVGMAAVSHSQTAATAAQSTTKAAVPAATPAIATPTAQPGQSAAQAERQRGGNHEGIQVHGHWTIDVRNPDGKLASHTEFENSLQASGANTLTGLLSGQYVSGGFVVGISTSTTPAAVADANTGSSGLCYLGVCTFYDSRTDNGCTPTLVTAGQCGLLTYAANGYAAGFTLTGTVVNVPSGGQIQSVASALFYCGNYSATSLQTSTAFVAIGSQQCGTTDPSTFPQGISYYEFFILTGATLPQPGSGQCGGSGQPECAVTVTAGQSVTVSVQITFGSGDTAAPGSASLPAAKSAK